MPEVPLISVKTPKTEKKLIDKIDFVCYTNYLAVLAKQHCQNPVCMQKRGLIFGQYPLNWVAEGLIYKKDYIHFLGGNI